MIDQLITITQAAAQLGCSRRVILSLIKRGELAEYQNRLDRRARLVAVKDVDRVQNSAITQLEKQPAAVAA